MPATITLPPCAPEIGTGDAVAIAPDFFWLRMPLAPPLAFVNVWVLGDDQGWTIIDTGLGDTATEAAWRAALARRLANQPVRRVLITHAHPDHAGSAGWLVADHGATFMIPAREYLHCRLLLAGQEDAATAQACHEAGWGSDMVAAWLARSEKIRGLFRELPTRFTPVAAGETLRIAGNWRVIGSSGHSPEHVTLYNAERRMVITGDQVLPNLAANVGAPPSVVGDDPMGDWIAGLLHLRAEVPDDVLVLPSHGDPFAGLHARIDALIAIYRGKIERTFEALDAPKRAIDLIEATAGKPVKSHGIGSATFETIACLQRLARDGRATARTGPDGVTWWSPAAR